MHCNGPLPQVNKVEMQLLYEHDPPLIPINGPNEGPPRYNVSSTAINTLTKIQYLILVHFFYYKISKKLVYPKNSWEK